MAKNKTSDDSSSLERDKKLMASHDWEDFGRYRTCAKCKVKQFVTARFSPETLANKWLPRIVPKCI